MEAADWNQLCTIQYYFGAGLQRLISVKHKGALKTQTLSLGGYEIRETTRSGSLVEKEIRSSFGNGARVKRWTATNPDIPIIAYEFSVTDHLGSDSVTYNGAGQLQNQRGHLKPGETQKTERQSYDAWGARRDGETWAPAVGQVGQGSQGGQEEEREGSNVDGGYTGHEMLDDVGLIHMNGRLYDPSLGRMCAADPYVQTPENLQNYNRYSYVLNNPLSQIDPSGHFIIGLIVGLAVAIAGIVAGVILTVVAFVAYLAALAAQFVLTIVGLNGAAAAMGTMGASCLAAAKAGVLLVSSLVTGSFFGGGLLGKMIGGAALSAIYNGAQTAINGGSFSDVLKSAAIGAATGAVGAMVGGLLAGIPDGVSGALTGSIGKGAAAIAGKVVHAAAHGGAGGLMSMAMGGTFKDGFIGSAIGAGLSHVTGAMFDGLNGNGIEHFLARTAIATIGGGVGSVLAGGKFADGAFSAAFFHVFNSELHRLAASDPRIEEMARMAVRKKIFLVNRLTDDQKGIGGRDLYLNWAQDMGQANNGTAEIIDVSQTNWMDQLKNATKNEGADTIAIFNHGTAGDQWLTGHGTLGPTSKSWASIVAAMKPNGRVLLMGCNTSYSPVGEGYIKSLAMTGYQKAISVTGMPTQFDLSFGVFVGSGLQTTVRYIGRSTMEFRYRPYSDGK